MKQLHEYRKSDGRMTMNEMNENMKKSIDLNAALTKEKEKEVDVDNINKRNESSNYRNLYVIIEQVDGKITPVGLEMLSEARRLINDFNKKYSLNEKVIAVILGNDIKHLCKDLIYHGSDAVIYADDPKLNYHINKIYTKVIVQIATDTNCIKKISPEYSKEFKRPRYMFFAADSTGRHLSSTVLAELESGLASDINKLVIEDIDFRHEHKTKGQMLTFEKTLMMYRPDFSGFLWTTILCLDNKNPDIKRDYHPQACSIIPGVFEPLEKDISRIGIIEEYTPDFDPKDLDIKIISRNILKDTIDFNNYKTIISFGRGIKESPEENIKLIEKLAKLLNAEIGISLPISKKLFKLSDKMNSLYITPERVIGTSGQKVEPTIYIALGISGASQHLAGMKNSGFIIAVNPDENAPIRNECDVFIKGRIEDVLPIMIEELEREKMIQTKEEEGSNVVGTV
ncbi:MAG: electron transfer flavoprotein subunit alpha/FixB family protein [Candidatus Nitrosocosmicus sp.]|nr:electron transfer flavoprotein subunit alpha/FixB family protein [Candidatus Nitrosocosmicus sp.]MDN5867140.1 electron transfer flavoprotein subunit alpha/FixB family protein [Candidatus Nitrosocosmicus sp.]